MSKEREKIGSLLIRYGFITESDLVEGLKLQKLMGLKLGETLVKIGKVDEANIQWILSKQYDVPFVVVDHVNIDKNLVQKFTKKFLIENRVIPLFETEDEICIVTDDIFNYNAFAFIENVLGKKVNISIGEAKKIENTLINFFKEDASPTIISVLQKTLDLIKETGFYRVDIAIQHHKSVINVYGNGVLRNIAEIDTTFKKEEVFGALGMLEIPYAYEIHDNFKTILFSIYPLINIIEDIRYPAILGLNGLVLPTKTILIDMPCSEHENLIYSDKLLYGYPYFSLKFSNLNYDRAIYTTDSAPKDFSDYYINLYAPKKCDSCNTSGCQKCKQLGYTFTKVEGIYTSKELKQLLS